jgi:exonuclease SbcD
VNQAEVGETNTLFGVSDVEVLLSTLTSGQPFPYYALGHLHKHQVLSSDPAVAYAGSLERIDFGEGETVDVPPGDKVVRREAEAKGFVRIDLVEGAGTWTLASPPLFTPVHSRAFVTVRCGELDQNDPIADLAGRLDRARVAGVSFDDAIVRIRANVPASDRARITHGTVDELISEAYDIRLSLDTSDKVLVRDPRFAEAMSEIQAFDHYLETRTDWADDADGLRSLAHMLIKEAL